MNTPEILTPIEKERVDAFIECAKKLPDSICIKVDDFCADDPDEPTLIVSKKLRPGMAQHVASLRKESLVF